jgi:hypothetical protein
MNNLELSDLGFSIKEDDIYSLIDNLRFDLLAMGRSINSSDSLSMNLAKAIERNALKILDLISPEIRRVEAISQRYQSALKIGDH